MSKTKPDLIGSGEGEAAKTPAVDYYRNTLTTIRAHIPWKPLMNDVHGRAIHPRPIASGTLTAIDSLKQAETTMSATASHCERSSSLCA